MSKIGKILIIITVVVVIFVSSFVVVLFGVIDTTWELIKAAASEVAESVSNGIAWLGWAKVTKGLPTFIINKDEVASLKNSLDSQKIDTDVAGLTEVRLRKILLAYAVSNSLSDTLCAVEVSQEEIIDDYKEKNKIDKNTEVTIDTIKANYTQEYANVRWNTPSNFWNYILYIDKNIDGENDSNIFFYFYDTDKEFGTEPKWYLGAMGTTTIKTSDGETLEYFDQNGFNKIEENFKSAGLDPLKSEAYQQMKKAYTKDINNPNIIKLYTVDVNQKKYYYSFENTEIANQTGEKIKIEVPEAEEGEEQYDVDRDSTYDVQVQEINLAESIDLSKYSLSIELMMNLLNITGSTEFVEKFIDYSLQQINTSVTAYMLNSESITYNQKTYDVSSDFILEVYDFDDANGWEFVMVDGSQELIATGEGDNFKAYYDIAYNRKYNGTSIGKVTDITNYKDIDYVFHEGNDLLSWMGGEYENPKGDLCSANKFHTYLKTAYDPGSEFRLGTIKVKEVILNVKETNKWETMVTKIETWYGDFTYNIPNPEYVYTIDGEDKTEEQYNSYNQDDLIESTSSSNETIERRLISNSTLKQLPDGYVDISNTEIQKNEDIVDDPLQTVSGADNRAQFGNWTVNGLNRIAQVDFGEKNEELGAGRGSDYVYCKYTKTNVKQYTTKVKSKTQIINEINVTQTTPSSDVETKLKNFLELLRNKTGKIPTSIGSEGGFTGKDEDPSIVVEYVDIYEGTIPAGDLLLDDGALMLFDLLEAYSNTQSLVPVFKYLAYLYTGTDYGVTSIEDLTYILNLNSVLGFYGSSIEEKLWNALREAGFSEFATAGIMGNLWAESGLKSNNLENSHESYLGYTDETYTAAINSGSYTRDDFISDHKKYPENCGAGYGLAQWTYYTRKGALYDYCKSKGVSIDDENTQIEFLIKEIKANYLNNSWVRATSVEEATENFCWTFENPDAELAHMNDRINMANQYYNNRDNYTQSRGGTYNGTAAEKMCQAAEVIRQHCTQRGYTYKNYTPDYSEGIRALWNKDGVCCASYVAWVLVESGVVSESYMNTVYYRGVNELYQGLMRSGKFTDVGQIPQSSMKKGDIIFWLGHHTQMYAGNNYWYNGGHTTNPNVVYSDYDAPNYFRSAKGWTTYHVLRVK